MPKPKRSSPRPPMPVLFGLPMAEAPVVVRHTFPAAYPGATQVTGARWVGLGACVIRADAVDQGQLQRPAYLALPSLGDCDKEAVGLINQLTKPRGRPLRFAHRFSFGLPFYVSAGGVQGDAEDVAAAPEGWTRSDVTLGLYTTPGSPCGVLVNMDFGPAPDVLYGSATDTCFINAPKAADVTLLLRSFIHSWRPWLEQVAALGATDTDRAQVLAGIAALVESTGLPSALDVSLCARLREAPSSTVLEPRRLEALELFPGCSHAKAMSLMKRALKDAS